MRKKGRQKTGLFRTRFFVLVRLVLFYKSPIWPKKVRLMTGTSASKNAMLISSFCVASSAAFAQVSHCAAACGDSGDPVSICISPILFFVLIFSGSQERPYRLLGLVESLLRKKKRMPGISPFTRLYFDEARPTPVEAARFSFLNTFSIAEK
ncbi:MAG: hypothetical protein A3J06_00180 [Candidatus Moranbacteria bacterium RIFCSPLOWO2_02_FULL_48_19]|nr:MAG: hypothetical protein A3J06_00180 [Candidatus Moranbacteria bacterium RIFCSPLOWO2_02_FULL_48_19]OGI30044.1 MAG: hypothetical protein A3G09_01400 [Candidatus Moranbacteria bacterium RIFCSPLOWO2_12_FULL_48_12]